MKGAKERYGEPDEKTLERIRYELGTIEWMGFPGYFLIVSDFIRAAREMGVSVGPRFGCRLRRRLLSEDNKHRPP